MARGGFPGMMGGGNMQQLARQAQKLQQQMAKVQEELEQREYEASAGVTPKLILPDHPIAQGVPGDWPQVLGYNRLTAKPGAEVIAKLNDDPMIVAGSYGQGRVVAYATDCAPHWSPEAFCCWPGYQTLWGNIVAWLTARDQI